MGCQNPELGARPTNHRNANPRDGQESGEAENLGRSDTLFNKPLQRHEAEEDCGPDGGGLEEEMQSDRGEYLFAGNDEASPRPSDIWALLNRQKKLCAYTSDPLTPDSVSPDHIVPFSEGGGHGISNIALVTSRVNAAKGSMSLEEFVTMCRKVVAKFGAVGPVILKD